MIKWQSIQFNLYSTYPYIMGYSRRNFIFQLNYFVCFNVDIKYVYEVNPICLGIELINFAFFLISEKRFFSATFPKPIFSIFEFFKSPLRAEYICLSLL